MDLHRAVPILTVSDVPAAVRAWTTLLGCDVLMDHGWIATLGTAGQAQFSVMDRDATAAMNPVASLQVDDVDLAHRAAVDAGWEIVHPLRDEPWGVRRFFVRDREGNVVNVLSHGPTD